MKIHKSKSSLYGKKIETLCGIIVRYRHISYQWKDVNCKRCLKKKLTK